MKPVGEAAPSRDVIEAEILDLSKKIEAKREQLRVEHGETGSKQVIHATLADELRQSIGHESGSVTVSTAKMPEYLETLDEATAQKLQNYVDETFSHGIRATFKKLKNEEPFVIDAYHDIIVGPMHDELVKRKLISQ